MLLLELGKVVDETNYVANLVGKVSLTGGACALYTFFKVRNNMTPYLKESLHLKRSLLFGNFNPHLYREISCNTDRYINSFFPNSTQSWNNIDINFQSSLSLGTLKIYIFSLIRPISKSTFGIHDPQGIKKLFKLQVGLSPPRHKTTHNFLDTPNNWCDCLYAPEDTKHF